MSTSAAEAPENAGLLDRLDQLYEFEREPVTEDSLQPGSYFAGVFAGEHVAGTEFVIGALFVQFGAGVFDVIVGLLLGNLLAVLSWTFVCAPIAVQTRLTLYWYLRKIAGPILMVICNVLNALLYCVLAGAMITVSASAIRIPFGVAPQVGWLPQDPSFVLIVLVVGAVVVTLAILGFKRLAQFSAVCSPWMTLMFVAGALALLPVLGQVTSLEKFWRIAGQSIWAGPAPGQTDALGFWHVVAFAWICNLAMHLGLSDMALFRFARRPAYGLYSAFGMYVGHYLAWICAGIMGAGAAALLRTRLAELDPGAVAVTALGPMGALTVVVAGWTTANPTLYRAGLALQVVTPGWPRWLVTLIAGAITTIIACFPWVFVKLLGFVAIYGILLVPVGAIVVTEHWLFPRIGFTQYWSTRKGNRLNVPALVSWLLAIALTAGAWASKYLFDREIIHEFFLAIPVWIATSVSYVVLAGMAGARRPQPELPAEPPPKARPAVLPQASADSVGLSLAERFLLAIAGVAALTSLALWVWGNVSDVSNLGPHAENMAYIPSVLGYLPLTFYFSAAVWLHLWEKSLPRRPLLYTASGAVALTCLILCVAFPAATFLGWTTRAQLHSHLVLLTIIYFLSGVVWMRQREKRPAPAC